MIPDCDGQTVKRSDGQTESIIAKTALCIASYADALSKTVYTKHGTDSRRNLAVNELIYCLLARSVTVIVCQIYRLSKNCARMQ